MRKNKRTKLKKQRKLSSQLFRLCSMLKDCFFSDSNQHVESFNSKRNSPWKKSAIDVQIDSNDKVTAAENHRKLVDRKSTRLNSSHLGISYAVFCLKKKKN